MYEKKFGIRISDTSLSIQIILVSPAGLVTILYDRLFRRIKLENHRKAFRLFSDWFSEHATESNKMWSG